MDDTVVQQFAAALDRPGAVITDAATLAEAGHGFWGFGGTPGLLLRPITVEEVTVALALGATAVGIGRPYAYALSYGGTESLTHYLKSFLAEFDLTLANCGFKDIATLKAAGCEPALTAGR